MTYRWLSLHVPMAAAETSLLACSKIRSINSMNRVYTRCCSQSHKRQGDAPHFATCRRNETPLSSKHRP